MTFLVSITAINVPGRMPRIRLRINQIPRFRIQDGRPARFWEAVRMGMSRAIGGNFRYIAAEALEVVLVTEEL